MFSFIAHDKISGLVSNGSYSQVLSWSATRIEKSPQATINIVKCRLGEGGRVVAEVDGEGISHILAGRFLSHREMMKLLSRC